MALLQNFHPRYRAIHCLTHSFFAQFIHCPVINSSYVSLTQKPTFLVIPCLTHSLPHSFLPHSIHSFPCLRPTHCLTHWDSLPHSLLHTLPIHRQRIYRTAKRSSSSWPSASGTSTPYSEGLASSRSCIRSSPRRSQALVRLRKQGDYSRVRFIRPPTILGRYQFLGSYTLQPFTCDRLYDPRYNFGRTLKVLWVSVLRFQS